MFAVASLFGGALLAQTETELEVLQDLRFELETLNDQIEESNNLQNFWTPHFEESVDDAVQELYTGLLWCLLSGFLFTLLYRSVLER